jgi:SagB-type dehydrogenase family enzyme
VGVIIMESRSKIIIVIIIILIIILGVNLITQSSGDFNVKQNISIVQNQARTVTSTINLNTPQLKGNISVEEAIKNRRSVRRFNSNPLTLQQVSQLLWAAQGITDTSRNYRAAPSGGHVFPLEMYLVSGNNSVNDIPAGIYHYDPYNNRIEKIVDGDVRNDLYKAAHNQQWVNEAPISLVITGNFQKMINKYPDTRISTRFVDMEAGHAGENIYLQAESLGLGTVAIGSFYDDQMISLFKLPANETPLYIYPVGYTS